MVETGKESVMDLSLVDEEYLHIVQVLLEHEDWLSDGYGYYMPTFHLEDEAEANYEGNVILAGLVHIARKIQGE